MPRWNRDEIELPAGYIAHPCTLGASDQHDPPTRLGSVPLAEAFAGLGREIVVPARRPPGVSVDRPGRMGMIQFLRRGYRTSSYDIRLRSDNATDAPLVIVCGLAAEAQIARGPGIVVIQSGGDGRRLQEELEVAAPGARAIISFGVAGGIAPDLRPGDVRIADVIIAPDGTRFFTDSDWSAAVARELDVPLATFVGVDTPLGDIAGKAAMFKSTGAAAADMESHIVASVAARHETSLLAIRVVTDPAQTALPHAATVGMRSDGTVNFRAIFRSLAKNPGQLPALIRTGLDARQAFASLLRCRELLGPSFAFLDLGHPVLDVP